MFSLSILIRKEIVGKVENRLKLFTCNSNDIGSTYKSLIEDRSKEDFDRLISFLGLKKSDIFEYEKAYL